MVDILSQLQPTIYSTATQFVEFPSVTVDFGFSNENAEHKFIFRDEALIQQLGKKNRTWRLEIPFKENLNFANYKNLYTIAFPKFLSACQEKTPGQLTTPDIGQIRVAVASFSYSIDAKERDGVNVHVEFISAPLDDDQPVDATSTLESLASQGFDLDAQVALVKIPVQTFPETSFGDPFTAVSSVLDQLSNSRNKSFAKFDHAIEQVNKLNDSIDRLVDPKNWSVKRQANDFKAALHRTQRLTDSKGVKIKVWITTRDIPANVAASKLGLTLREFYQLNPEESGLPIILKGTTLRYYDKSQSLPAGL